MSLDNLSDSRELTSEEATADVVDDDEAVAEGEVAAVEAADADVAEADAEDVPEEADGVERAAQGLITIGLFLGFVTFILFCLPMYFFN